ncbi:YhdT family protein [Endozoicomonas sp.]|nr:YhdT family protein [Endozoicomonas sp.]
MNTLRYRYSQAHREARWAIGLTLVYFLWWYLSAYSFAPEKESLESLSLVLGLPLWFLLSCVVGPCLFILLCALMVRYVFQDMPLGLNAAESGGVDEH